MCVFLRSSYDFSDSFLNKAPIKVIVDKIKIEEDTYKMLFFLNEEEYKYTLHLKIILRVLDFVNLAYHELVLQHSRSLHLDGPFC